jgi:hypothetical protein
MRKIDKIIIHHTAGSLFDTVDDIRHFHIEKRGYNDIGYHAVVTPDGTVCAGRPAWKIGAHCKFHNTGSLGLSFIGFYHPPKNNKLSQLQINGAVQQLVQWCRSYNISPQAIYPHSKFGSTACPGDRIRERMPEIQRLVAAELQKQKIGG